MFFSFNAASSSGASSFPLKTLKSDFLNIILLSFSVHHLSSLALILSCCLHGSGVKPHDPATNSTCESSTKWSWPHVVLLTSPFACSTAKFDPSPTFQSPRWPQVWFFMPSLKLESDLTSGFALIISKWDIPCLTSFAQATTVFQTEYPSRISFSIPKSSKALYSKIFRAWIKNVTCVRNPFSGSKLLHVQELLPKWPESVLQSVALSLRNSSLISILPLIYH